MSGVNTCTNKAANGRRAVDRREVARPCRKQIGDVSLFENERRQPS